MKLTPVTKAILESRRQRRRLLAHGYEEVGESGGRLWELQRGHRTAQKICDVVIAADGKSLFVKIA